MGLAFRIVDIPTILYRFLELKILGRCNSDNAQHVQLLYCYISKSGPRPWMSSFFLVTVSNASLLRNERYFQSRQRFEYQEQ